jgi:hypothetical protein
VHATSGQRWLTTPAAQAINSWHEGGKNEKNANDVRLACVPPPGKRADAARVSFPPPPTVTFSSQSPPMPKRTASPATMTRNVMTLLTFPFSNKPGSGGEWDVA